jgi:hypothetical protein
VGLGAVAPWAGVGVAVAVGTVGRVLVAVGVTVAVGVAVRVGVAVLVLVGVGVGVAVEVGVNVGVGKGAGVGVSVGRGIGVGSSNRKFARALVPPSRQVVSTVTSIVTVSPGDPLTVKLPLRLPPAVDPVPDACPAGAEVTVTFPSLHHPLPESVPLTDGAGPDAGLSTSVATWA